MKILLLIIAIFLSSCQNSFKSNSSNEANLSDPAKKVVAEYSLGEVTYKNVNIELEKLILQNPKLKGLTFEKLSSDQKEAIIKEVVLNEIAYREAKKRNLNKDADYQEALKVFETELLKQKLILALTKEASSEKNVKKNYNKLFADLKNKKDLRISYIIVKTKAEADVIYDIVFKNPNYFASQARKKSLDKVVAKKGGDLGFVNEDLLPSEINSQAKLLKKGEVSKPIQLSDKWAIIRLEDSRSPEILPYDKAKNPLAQSLAKRAIEDFFKKNLEKAKISILIR